MQKTSKRDSTRIALIEAAETLFATLGVDGVSTRQLGTAIGSSNTNVVAYHFGSKDALVEAVYHHRLPAIDRRRGELLREADSTGKGSDLLTLVRAFALPLLEQTDAQGRHSYARFVAAIERLGMNSIRGLVIGQFPETERLLDRIADCLSQLSRSDIHLRVRLATSLIVTALQIGDMEANRSSPKQQQLFETALMMATAGLAVPLTSRPAN